MADYPQEIKIFTGQAADAQSGGVTNGPVLPAPTKRRGRLSPYEAAFQAALLPDGGLDWTMPPWCGLGRDFRLAVQAIGGETTHV